MSSKLAACAGTLVLSGCLGSYKEPVRTVSSTDQAAAVLVTPTMVAPWKDVTDALSPNFTMSGDAAVAKVLPTTQRIQDQVLRALGLSLAIGLPSTSSTSSNTITHALGGKSATDANGTVTTSSTTDNSSSDTSTSSKVPGTVPTAPTGAPASGALPGGMANSGDLGVDPVLQYKAANYLQQSVQLLNREVQNAAQRTCYDPYVVKLKMAVMPYKPDLGYDLHTRISFASTGGAGHFGAFDKATYGSYDAKSKKAVDERRSIDPCLGEGHVPVVVPLLAADDLQMATRAKAIEEAQQIGFALNLMVHGVGANLGANKLNQTMHAILNNELSSSLTVARETDNTLYVRVSANNIASGSPSLVGQTYDIALLLLVPHHYFEGGGLTTVGISTFTEFRDATSGAVLDRRSSNAVIARANQLLEPHLAANASTGAWAVLTTDEKQFVLGRLLGPIETGDYAGFLQAMAIPFDTCDATRCPHMATPLVLSTEGSAPSLWAALSALVADSAFKTTLLELPVPQTIRTSGQDVFVLDDGKDTATTLITGISGYSAGSLRPTLHVVPLDKGKPQSLVTIPVQTAAFDASAQSLTLSFPSLTKIGIAKTAPTGNTLDLSLAPCDDTKRNCPSLNGATTTVSYVAHLVASTPASKKAAVFVMTPAAPTIVIQKGSEGAGHAAIVITKLPKGETAAIAITGAEMLSATNAAGSALPLTDDGYTITGNGTYTFGFRGLREDSTISLTGLELKNGAKLGTTPLSIRATTR